MPRKKRVNKRGAERKQMSEEVKAKNRENLKKANEEKARLKEMRAKGLEVPEEVITEDKGFDHFMRLCKELLASPDVAPEIKANLEMRIQVRTEARTQVLKQRELIERCKSDIVFFFNCWVWQYDPTQADGARTGPFVLWPCQEKLLLDRPETTGRKGLLWCVENKEPMVLEKVARDGGDVGRPGR